MKTPRADYPNPFELLDAQSVRELEQRWMDAMQMPIAGLMERAGAAIYRHARVHWPETKRWFVVCGPGNNGGDGYVVARLAEAAGVAVCLIRVDKNKELPVPARQARESFLSAGGIEHGLSALASAGISDLIIDAVLGIGVTRAIEGEFAAAIDAINSAACPVFAIDVPSGLNADTGATSGSCVQARRTLSLVAWKRGLFTGRGPLMAGRLQLDSLQRPLDAVVAQQRMRLLDPSWIKTQLPPRARDAHKGHHGHVLVVGGDVGMGGAALLAAEAALRSGAGWVSLATRAEHVSASLMRCPEVMVRAVDDANALQPMLDRADVVLIGPGLGQLAWGRALLERVVSQNKPVVLDADALNLMSIEPWAWPRDVIITPHPGEAARLLKTTTVDIEKDRYAAVNALHQRCSGVAILKGAGSLITDGESTFVCPRGNPGMASAGMGDVLAGLVAALRAQKLSSSHAAAVAVWVHATAGDIASQKRGERGLTASDLLDHVSRVVNP